MKNASNSMLFPGKIENLEEYVDPEWYSATYPYHLYPVTYMTAMTSQTTSQEVELVKSLLDLKKDDTVLDLACGTGRHLIMLAKQGFLNLHGVDLSDILLIEAKKESQNLTINFKRADMRSTGYPDGFFDKIFIMGSSLGFFSSVEDNQQVFTEAYRLLKPGGGKVLIDNADGNFVRKNFSPSLLLWGKNGFFSCMEKKLDGNRMMTREIIVDPEKGVIYDHVYSVQLYTGEELILALGSAGFKNIRHHEDFTLNQGKDQDVHMMSHRLLITAQKL